MSDHINDHTCTHHNDAQRSAAMLECPVCLLRERNEARDKVSDLVNSGAVLIALHRSEREELSEWKNGTIRLPCEHDVTALDFAGQTQRANEARDAAVAELARVKTKCVAPALYQLETIRTEQIMVAGFPETATAISHARVALGDAWPEVDQDRTGYVDELEALRAEVTRHKADAEMLDWILMALR